MIYIYLQYFLVLISFIFFIILLIRGVKLELLLIKSFKINKKNLGFLPIFLNKNWHETYKISKGHELYENCNNERIKVFELFKIFFVFELLVFIIMLFL